MNEWKLNEKNEVNELKNNTKERQKTMKKN